MAAYMAFSVLVTTSVTADQQIHSISTAVNINVKFMSVGAAFTIYSATEAYLGFARFQKNLAGSWATVDRSPAFVNTDLDNNCPMIIRPLGVGMVLAAGTGLRAICTPMTATSIRWPCSIWGET